MENVVDVPCSRKKEFVDGIRLTLQERSSDDVMKDGLNDEKPTLGQHEDEVSKGEVKV